MNNKLDSKLLEAISTKTLGALDNLWQSLDSKTVKYVEQLDFINTSGDWNEIKNCTDVDHLLEYIKVLHNKNALLATNAEKYQKRINELELKQQTDALMTEQFKKSFKTTIEEISKRNKEIQQAENARIKKLLDFQEEFQNFQDKIASMDEEIRRLRSELFEERKLKNEQISWNSKVSNELSQLKNENLNLKRETGSLMGELQTTTNKLKQLERDVEEYQKHSLDSKAIMRQAQEKIGDLELQLLNERKDFKILHDQIHNDNFKQMADQKHELEKKHKAEIKKLREKAICAEEECKKWFAQFKHLENNLEKYKQDFNEEVQRNLVKGCHEMVKDIPKISRNVEISNRNVPIRPPFKHPHDISSIGSNSTSLSDESVSNGNENSGRKTHHRSASVGRPPTKRPLKQQDQRGGGINAGFVRKPVGEYLPKVYSGRSNPK